MTAVMPTPQAIAEDPCLALSPEKVDSPARRFAPWRAASLIAVHLLIGLHLAHWKIAGRTLAPLELNEVMHTLELGVVTAGFLLMATAVISVGIVGRFFCSWGCHLLALEDLAAKLLAGLGIRPRPVRSRLLAWVPAGAAFYMFLWPQIARWTVRVFPAADAWIGPRPEFQLRVLGDGEGWASFLTTDFARNLPGPGIAVVTLLCCGFAVVWFLGTRAFCRNVCPYGAVFSFVDRFSPGRIVLAGDCTQCGRCTAVCDSGLRVHEEIARHAAVTSGGCLKDLDCVTVCPTRGLKFGFRRPPFWRRRGVARPWDLTLAEDTLAAGAFVIVLLAARGLYRLVPFFLALALAGLAAYLTVLAVRLTSRREVWMQQVLLRRAGRATRQGWIFAGCFTAALLATGHATVVRAHEWFGDRAWEAWRLADERGGPATAAARAALGHAEARARLGWIHPPDLEPRLAALRRALGRLDEAEAGLRRLTPRDPRARLDLAEVLAERGRLADAERELRAALVEAPELAAAAHYGLGVVLAAGGRGAAAEGELRAALSLAPDDPQTLNNLGFLLASRGEAAEAESLFERARARAPGWALPCHNLVELLAATQRAAAATALAAECP